MSETLTRLRKAEDKGWMILCTSTGGDIYPDDLDAYNAIRDPALIAAVLETLESAWDDGDSVAFWRDPDRIAAILRKVKEATP